MFQQANPGVVTTLENRMHRLQTGDKVTFKEIVGMTALNGSEQTVKGEDVHVYRSTLYMYNLQCMFCCLGVGQ